MGKITFSTDFNSRNEEVEIDPSLHLMEIDFHEILGFTVEQQQFMKIIKLQELGSTHLGQNVYLEWEESEKYPSERVIKASSLKEGKNYRLMTLDFRLNLVDITHPDVLKNIRFDYRSLDLNKDNTVEMEEVTKVLRLQLAQQIEDVQMDSTLNSDEKKKKVTLCQKRASRQLEELKRQDINQDGILQLEEYLSWRVYLHHQAERDRNIQMACQEISDLLEKEKELELKKNALKAQAQTKEQEV